MEFKERIALIIKENSLKQKDLAAIMGVTESYISALLSGRSKNLSIPLANLIEEKLGYSAQWILTGQGPKFKRVSDDPTLSSIHKKAIRLLENLPDDQVLATIAFMDSLEKLKNLLTDEDKP